MKKQKTFHLVLISLFLLFIACPQFSQALDENSGISRGEFGEEMTTTAATLEKGPYLLLTGDNASMKVLWQTDKTPSSAKIAWGSTEDYGEGEVEVTENGASAYKHQFFYTIKNLAPKTQVYYKVTVDGSSHESSFMTMPYDSAETLSFYAYGDTRTNPADHDLVALVINSDMAADPDNRETFILHGGDFTTYGMTESSWDLDYFNRTSLGATRMFSSLPVIGTIGNHELAEQTSEIASTPGALFRKYWPEPFFEKADHFYYSFDYGPMHIAVVDQFTASYNRGSGQYQWLEEDLAASAKLWKVVMFHEPAWSAGGHENNQTAQEDLTPLFERYGVKLVLQGHNHYYSRAEVNGVTYLTLGGGGAPLYTPDASYPHVVKTSKSHHFARFDVVKNNVTTHVMGTDGEEIDSFSLATDPKVSSGFVLAAPHSSGGPQIRTFDAAGTPLTTFMAYGENLRGEFYAKSGDLDGDGDQEIVTVPGAGLSPQIRAFEADGTFLDHFFAYDENFRGGVNFILADLNHDQKDEIVTSPASGGGPNIRVYSLTGGKFSLLDWTDQVGGDFHGGFNLAKFSPGPDQRDEFVIAPTPGSSDGKVRHFTLESGALNSEYLFEPYDAKFFGGINLATGDLDGDNVDEVMVAPASGGGPNVRVYKKGNLTFELLAWSFVYDNEFHGGISLAAGDYDADGRSELTVAPASGGGPNLRTYEYRGEADLAPINGFFAYDKAYHAGVNLAAGDLDEDGRAELVVAPKAGGPNVRLYDFENTTFSLKSWFWAYGEKFSGGVNIGVGRQG